VPFPPARAPRAPGVRRGAARSAGASGAHGRAAALRKAPRDRAPGRPPPPRRRGRGPPRPDPHVRGSRRPFRRATLPRSRGNSAAGGPLNQQFYKNMAVWVVILVMILLMVTMFRQGDQVPPEKDYSEFVALVEKGQVEKVLLEDGYIRGETAEGPFSTYAPPE